MNAGRFAGGGGLGAGEGLDLLCDSRHVAQAAGKRIP
jgi:hypothetical protein